MINLPDLRRPENETRDLCKCRPICKSRRREWKGKVQKTSAELLIERKPVPECIKRRPKQVYPNSPCPLLGKWRRVAVNERTVIRKPAVVQICQAPIDDTVETPYLLYAEMAKRLGAWAAVKARCAHCCCGGACCPCALCGYEPRDAERVTLRRSDMKAFDARVKHDYKEMRIMYDKP